jgi:hypothetical protein
VKDKCRVVALVGMGGIGKTSLAVKLKEQIQGEFEHVIEESLKNAPPLQELLGSWLKVFSNQENKDIPDSIGNRIVSVMDFLSKNRCLLLLYDVDKILQAGKLVGQYREGYEEYDQLFKRVAERSYESCLLLISRDKPQTIESLEKTQLLVKCLQLQGLDDVAAK